MRATKRKEKDETIKTKQKRRGHRREKSGHKGGRRTQRQRHKNNNENNNWENNENVKKKKKTTRSDESFGEGILVELEKVLYEIRSTWTALPLFLLCSDGEALRDGFFSVDDMSDYAYDYEKPSTLVIFVTSERNACSHGLSFAQQLQRLCAIKIKLKTRGKKKNHVAI